ncbi:MAG: hypothetical protein H7A33_01160 [Deltaproteobacteria bacterium]|nr:hypothetical protein [Deltaproteobacteria bacterium]
MKLALPQPLLTLPALDADSLVAPKELQLTVAQPKIKTPVPVFQKPRTPETPMRAGIFAPGPQNFIKNKSNKESQTIQCQGIIEVTNFLCKKAYEKLTKTGEGFDDLLAAESLLLGELATGNHSVYEELAKVYVLQGEFSNLQTKYDNAVNYFEKAIDITDSLPNSPLKRILKLKSYLGIARSEMQAQRFELFEYACQSFSSTLPKNKKEWTVTDYNCYKFLLTLRVHCYEMQGKMSLAIQAQSDLITELEKERDLPEKDLLASKYRKAHLLYQTKRFSDALQFTDECIEQYQNSSDIEINLLIALFVTLKLSILLNSSSADSVISFWEDEAVFVLGLVIETYPHILNEAKLTYAQALKKKLSQNNGSLWQTKQSLDLIEKATGTLRSIVLSPNVNFETLFNAHVELVTLELSYEEEEFNFDYCMRLLSNLKNAAKKNESSSFSTDQKVTFMLLEAHVILRTPSLLDIDYIDQIIASIKALDPNIVNSDHDRHDLFIALAEAIEPYSGEESA